MNLLVSINPSTGLKIRSYNQHNDVEIDNILNSSYEAQKKWELLVEEQLEALKDFAL